MQISKKLLLLFGSLVLMLLLAEGLLRLFPLLRPLPRTYVGEYQNRPDGNGYLVADRLLGWKMRPRAQLGKYQTNLQGFRAPADFHPDDSCKLIAFAGDSFTFGPGIGFDKIFTSLVEDGIPGSCADNMGVPGFGLDQIWQTVRTQALPLHPSLVVVAFISGDFTRSEEAYRPMEGFSEPTFKLADGRLVQETAGDRPSFAIHFLQHHSSLWRALRLADRALAHRYMHGEWWHLNAAILDAIQDDCRQAGVPVLFVYIPSREWDAFPSLRSYMARKQANFVDLSEGEFALTPDMYISAANGHLNEKGHRRVADAILHWVQQNRSGFRVGRRSSGQELSEIF